MRRRGAHHHHIITVGSGPAPDATGELRPLLGGCAPNGSGPQIISLNGGVVVDSSVRVVYGPANCW